MALLEKQKPFLEQPAAKKLAALSEHPFDLKAQGALSDERIRKYQAESAGFRMLFATERVDDACLKELAALAEETGVVDKMEKMQSGEIVNFIEGFPSENRPALHTALRDFFDNPNPAKTAKQAAEMAKEQVEKLKKFEPFMNAFTDIVFIGIGGSELGPKANFVALEAYSKPSTHVHFLGNVDPDDSNLIFKNLDLSKTLVVVVSKAGTTLETVTNEEQARGWFKDAGLDPKDHFVAVTGEGGPMDDPSRYKALFYIWDWVGGRFSASSVSAGLIFTFACGFQTYWEFLQGAHDMDQAAKNKDILKNVPLMGALLEIWNHNFLGLETLAIIPYSRALSRYSAHVQQVEMESNGKRIDRHGEAVSFKTAPIFWGEPGTNAQHSFFQMIHQGTTVVPIEFIGFKDSQTGKDRVIKGSTSQEKLISNMFAQALALATGQDNSNPNKVFPGNRPSHILLAKKLTPRTLGALFAYYEHKAVFQGFIWNINSFDQEGVQLGKVLAGRFIELFKQKRGEKSEVQGSVAEKALLNQLDLL